MSADSTFVICRFLFDISALYLWGGNVFLWLQVPKGLSAPIWRQTSPLRMVCVALIASVTLLSLPLRSAMLMEDWSGALDPQVLADVLTETPIGTAWIGQAIAMLLLLAATLAPARLRLAATAIASGLLLATLVMIGHASGVDSGLLRLAHRLNDAIHVLAAGAWFGALIPVRIILNSLAYNDSRPDALRALIRFSTTGHLVALVILTGVANTVLVVGGLPIAWSQPYQALLAAKIALVTAMVILAILNRYHFVPCMQRSPSALLWLRLWTGAEIVLAIAVVALVSWFGMLEPTGE